MSISFKCMQCGRCCKQHGEYRYLYVEPEDILRISKFLGIAKNDFIAKYVKYLKHGTVIKFINRSCPFMVNDICSIHEAKPVQCSSWPFWDDNMKSNYFKRNIAEFCEGARLYNEKINSINNEE